VLTLAAEEHTGHSDTFCHRKVPVHFMDIGQDHICRFVIHAYGAGKRQSQTPAFKICMRACALPLRKVSLSGTASFIFCDKASLYPLFFRENTRIGNFLLHRRLQPRPTLLPLYIHKSSGHYEGL
jgi:hypothetical protein